MPAGRHGASPPLKMTPPALPSPLKVRGGRGSYYYRRVKGSYEGGNRGVDPPDKPEDDKHETVRDS